MLSFRDLCWAITIGPFASALSWEKRLPWTFYALEVPTQCWCSHWFNTYSHQGKQEIHWTYFQQLQVKAQSYHWSLPLSINFLLQFNMHVCVTSDCRIIVWCEQKRTIFQKVATLIYVPWNLVVYIAMLPNLMMTFADAVKKEMFNSSCSMVGCS